MPVKNNILVLTYWSYKDALIQTYTLPYVRMIRKIVPSGSTITLVTFENKYYTMSQPEAKKIKKALASEQISWTSNPYSRFGIISFFKNIFTLNRLLLLCLSKKITYIHAWCTPAGSIGYILSKLTNIPLVIDSYEPHAEAMVENGTWKKNSFAFKLLFLFEKLLSNHAIVTIAASSGMKEYALKKYNIRLQNFHVKPACVDFNLFDPSTSLVKKEPGTITCVYAGKLGDIYLKQEVFDFFKVAHTYWKEKFRVLLLTDASKTDIENHVKESELDTRVITSKFVAHKDIPAHLAIADFAINPVKPVPTKKYCTSIKDGEYWAMGLPVIIPAGISDDSAIIEKNNIGAVLYSLNRESYLDAVKKIDTLLNSSSLQKKKTEIREIARKLRGLEIADKVYRDIYQ